MLVTLLLVGAFLLFVGACVTGAVRAVVAFLATAAGVAGAGHLLGVTEYAQGAIYIVAIIAGAISAISVPWPQQQNDGESE